MNQQDKVRLRELAPWLHANSSGIYRPAAEAADLILSLLAENEELEKKAARYDWLRSALSDRGRDGRSHHFCSIAAGHPEELDAAIDVAMQPKGD